MLKKISIFLFIIISYGCSNIKNSQFIDYDQKYYFKSQTRLYLSTNKNKIIKQFNEFANHENLARHRAKTKCLNYIKMNNLNGANCKYMGTKPTTKILSNLN